MDHLLLMLLAGFGFACWVLACLRTPALVWARLGAVIALPWLAIHFAVALARAEAHLFEGAATMDAATAAVIALGAYALTATGPKRVKAAEIEGGENAG